VGLKNFQMGYGSALAYLLVVICIIISTIYFRRMRDRYEQKA
jgi:ABC-type sugar transport system permease subunit